MQVISMTDGKIKKGIIAGREVIVKQSSFDEIKKIEAARSVLREHELVLGGETFRFHLPKIYDYRDEKIFMEFLSGKNLEISLRTEAQRQQAVQTTNSLFQYLYDNQIYWGDFAPRNVIIDRDNHIINLCDFERGVNRNISGKEYLQNYAYEEYAAFLFPSERNFSEKLNHIFTVDSEVPIAFDDIKSKRVKSIIREQNLSADTLTNQTVANANRLIIAAETPYRKNGQSVFPIIELEQIKDRSYASFAKRVCQIAQKQGIVYGNFGRI